MLGEFMGVWSETWREIWQPLIEGPLRENDEGLPEDVFCELYRELSNVLRKPFGDAAIHFLLGDAIALRGVFDGAAQRGNPDLTHEVVKEAFEKSGAEEVEAPAERRTLLDAALSGLLGKPATSLLDSLLEEQARDAAMLEAARRRAAERTINDPLASREAFKHARADAFAGERALVGFFESVHSTLEEFENPGDDSLTNRYFNLLAAFIEKFSLRYDLRRPCILCPTLPGVFASLVRDLRTLTNQDTHLAALMKEYEDAIRDLRFGCTDGRIKTCMSKQFNLLEAIGAIAPGVTRDTLGGMCDQLATWPHAAVRESLKKLYGFASDYPGIRHGRNAAGKLREIDMRDMVALSILLAGFTPYLSNQLDADIVYLGG